VAHPKIYGLQFGGYDPRRGARRYCRQPSFFVVTGQRSYVFGLGATIATTFATRPVRCLLEARARWPQLAETLAQ
jgi:hypothetical protein